MNDSEYILITAAHNEENYIEKTIISVINQKHKPAEWIIISDSSTDSTETIVKKYIEENEFIKLLTNNRTEGRNFASKVFALNLGFDNIQTSDYNFIGILDADVSFEKNYYASLIREFEKNPKLGIGGGDYYDIIKDKKVHIYPSPYSVRGATQFFRKECFKQIGGIKPMKYGGEDALACYAARMNGWEIKNFGDLIVLHNRPTGTTDRHILRTRFRDGIVEYNLGYHPLFQFIKCIKRMNEKPFLIGSLLRFSGFWWGNIKREKRIISSTLINFIRAEQISRMFNPYFNRQ